MSAVGDPERIPVVVASGQVLERHDLVTPIDLMARAAEAAFDLVGDLRLRLGRLSVVDIMTSTGPAPATELASRLGLPAPATIELSTVGGNTPQWLVNRAAADIAAGRLGATLIVGAEAIRSSRARRAQGEERYVGNPSLPPDVRVGDALPGSGPAEEAIGLLAPIHVYPLFESVLAHRAGRGSDEHRNALGQLLAPFTDVAASHPTAWFPEARSAQDIATPTPDNRLVCDPYTKRMTAFLGSDQGAAVVVCSLTEAQRAGVADRAVYVWAGSEATDVRSVTARPDPGRSPAIAAAGEALWAAASAAAGRTLTIDDVNRLDLYSCFPSAVELACAALGVAEDDRRGLTVTGGLPYFGGPGNNYTTHAIATLTDHLRQDGGDTFGLATGLGWYCTKHALGLYGTSPPPGGFHWGDTAEDQQAIDASAVPLALSIDERQSADVVAATTWRDNNGTAAGAPVIARLADGRHMAATPADQSVLTTMGALDVCTLPGTAIVVEPGPARYRLHDS